jgi:GPH family glycoside/pentoside/hexuronide:cation symporter
MIVVLFSTKILYEAAYTMFNIPMGSLLSAMSKNDVERASLSSARGAGSGFGNALPGIFAPMIIAAFGERNTTGYMIVGIACALVGFVVCLLHYAMTEERVVVDSSSTPENIKVTDIITVLAKNRPFVALCIHGVCNCAMQYGSNALGMYMYSAVYHDVTYQSISSILSAPFMVGAMVAVPFLCKKYDLQKLIRLSLLASGLVCALLFVMHMVMDVHPLLHGVILGIGTGLSMVSVQMQWGLLGEAIDYNEQITGKRTEGSIYGTFNLARRIGQTIGQGFALYALGWIGYQGTVEIQTASTIFGMKILCVLVPAIFILGSWAAFKFVWNIPPKSAEKVDAQG